MKYTMFRVMMAAVLFCLLSTDIKAEINDDFSSKDWRLLRQTPGRINMTPGKMQLIDNPLGPGRTTAEKTFEVDIDSNPIFSVKVISLTKNAEVKLVQFSSKEKRRVFSIKAPGIYNINLKEKLGWKGKQKIKVYLYASGDEAEIEYGYVRFTDKPEKSYIQKKYENLVSDSSFEIQESYRPVYHQMGEYRLNGKESNGVSFSLKQHSHGKRSLKLMPGATWTFEASDRCASKGVFAADFKSSDKTQVNVEVVTMPLDIHGGCKPEVTKKIVNTGTQWKRIEIPFVNKSKKWSAIYSVVIRNTSNAVLWVDAAQLELETRKASPYRPEQVSLRNIDMMKNYNYSADSDSVKAHSPNKTGEVKIQVAIPKGFSFGELNVCGGVPFPKGELFQTAGVELLNAAGKRVPLQTMVLARRNTDGSIVSLLLDFRTEVKGDKIQDYTLRYSSFSQKKIKQKNLAGLEGNIIIINTGVVRAKINPASFRVFDEISSLSGGKAIKADSLDGSFFTGIDGKVYTSGLQKPEECVIERNGPEHVVIMLRGKHKNSDGASLLTYETRIHAFKNKAYFRIEHSIINQENPPSMTVRDIGLRLPAAAGRDCAFGLKDAPTLKIASDTTFGSITQLKTCFGANRYDVLLTRPNGSETILSDTVADGTANNGISAVAIMDFMELNPREIAIGKGYISAYFWPDSGVKDLSIPFGFSTTMRVYYSPFGADRKVINELAQAKILLQPDRDWIAKSKVFVPFIKSEEKRRLFPRAAAIEDNVFDLLTNFQTVSDFNGMFNYGDFGSPSYCMNHETEGADNFWLRYLCDASPDTYKQAEASTLHSRDVDVSHIRKMAAARHSHNSFGHTSYHFHTGHFWQSCLVWHYLLTGDRRSFDVAMASAAELIEKSSIRYKPGRERTRMLFHLAELYGLTGNKQFREGFERQYNFGAGSNIGHNYYSGLSLEALMKLYEVTGDKKYMQELVVDAGKCLDAIDKISKEKGDLHIGQGRDWHNFKAMGSTALLTGDDKYLKSLSEYFLPRYSYAFIPADYSVATSAPLYKAMKENGLRETNNMPERLLGIGRLTGSMPGRKSANHFKFEIPGDKPFVLGICKLLKFRYYSMFKYDADNQPKLQYKLNSPDGKTIAEGTLVGDQHEFELKKIKVDNPVKGDYRLDLVFSNDCWGAFSCTAPARLDSRRWFACRNALNIPVSFWVRGPGKGQVRVNFRWKYGNNNYAGKVLGAALKDEHGKVVSRQIWTIPMNWRNDAKSKYCTQQLNLDIPDKLRGKALKLLVNDNKWLEWKVEGLDYPFFGSTPGVIDK